MRGIPDWCFSVADLVESPNADGETYLVGVWGRAMCVIAPEPTQPGSSGDGAHRLCFGRDQIPTARLYERRSHRGQRYLGGMWGGIQVLVFAHPDYKPPAATPSHLLCFAQPDRLNPYDFDGFSEQPPEFVWH